MVVRINTESRTTRFLRFLDRLAVMTFKGLAWAALLKIVFGGRKP